MGTKEGPMQERVRLKRAYDSPSSEDGRRYLVDGLWPRGVRREDLRISAWLKELSPSPDLRSWYGHDVQRFPRFRERFRQELVGRSERLDELAREATREPVTLVFAARDTAHSNAAVLQELLLEKVEALRSNPPNPPRRQTGDRSWRDGRGGP